MQRVEWTESESFWEKYLPPLWPRIWPPLWPPIWRPVPVEEGREAHLETQQLAAALANQKAEAQADSVELSEAIEEPNREEEDYLGYAKRLPQHVSGPEVAPSGVELVKQSLAHWWEQKSGVSESGRKQVGTLGVS